MPPNPASNKNVRETLDAIRRIVHTLRVSAREAEKRTGLSGAQLFVLYKLAEGGGLSVNALAERTRTHQSSVSAVVQRLADRKLVRRHADAQDRRRMVLTLTADGRKLLARAPAAAQERLIAALEALPPAHQRQLARALGLLLRNLGLGHTVPPLFFEEQPLAARRGKKRTHG